MICPLPPPKQLKSGRLSLPSLGSPKEPMTVVRMKKARPRGHGVLKTAMLVVTVPYGLVVMRVPFWVFDELLLSALTAKDKSEKIAKHCIKCIAMVNDKTVKYSTGKNSLTNLDRLENVQSEMLSRLGRNISCNTFTNTSHD